MTTSGGPVCSEETRLRVLETERLLLRRIRRSDIEALVDLWSDPRVTAALGGPRDPGRLAGFFAEAAVDPFADDLDLWPLVERASNRIIGHCGLLEKEVDGRNEIEISYILATAVWGRGYATEIAAALRDHAFLTIGLSRVIALIEPGNVASERVAIKIGMRLEREIVRPGGAIRRVYGLEAPRRES